jgi:hypothetical protein
MCDGAIIAVRAKREKPGLLTRSKLFALARISFLSGAILSVLVWICRGWRDP